MDIFTDTTPNTIGDVHSQEKFDDLAISSQDRVSEKINKVINSNEAKRRWFWELIQNAKDTVVKQRKVSIRLKYTRDINGKLVLIFEHSGNPFKPSPDPTRFDDLKNIVLTGSGKPPKIGVTGKFGTGFQSTHILSLYLKIEGAYQTEHGAYKFFDVTLDRTAFDGKEENRQNRIKSISGSLNDIKNFKDAPNDYSPCNTEFRTTKFTYFLDYNLHGLDWAKRMIEEGLKDIHQTLPFTLVYVPEIDKVTIIDEVNAKTITEFSISKTDNIDVIKTTTISKKVTDLNQEVVVNPSPKTIIASISNDYAEVAIQIDDSNGIRLCDFSKQYSTETGTEFPILFSSFPLVGSEDFQFPLVVNSNSFKPEETRDGIELKTNRDGNQNIIVQAISLYKEFLYTASRLFWQDIYLLAKTSKSAISDNHKWLSRNWYETEVLKPLRNEVLFTQLVDVQLNQIFMRRAIKSRDGDNQIFFPINENMEKLHAFGNDIFPNSLPMLKDVSNWNSILWDNSTFTKINIDFIIVTIAKHLKVENLAKRLYNDITRIDDTLSWLHRLYEFIMEDFEDRTFQLFNYSKNNEPLGIIPNRELEFKTIIELKEDVGYNGEGVIDDKLLKIHHSLCPDAKLKSKLLHENFSQLLPTKDCLKESDIAALIRDIIDSEFKKGGEYSLEFVKTLSEIYNWLSYEEDSKRVNSNKGYFDDALKRKILETIMPPGKEIYLTKLLELDRDGKVDMARQAEILSDPELEEKLTIGKKVLEKQRRFRENKRQGEYYEDIFYSIMKKYNQRLDTNKIDGEQDFIITNISSEEDYYVEIKSVGSSETEILLTDRQAKMAKRHPANYFLCVIRITDNPTEEYFKSNAYFNGNIGNILSSKVTQAEDFESPQSGLTVRFEDEILEQFNMYRYKIGIDFQYWGEQNFNNFISKLL
jgi:hypothetical protein